jgi:hypothetical protein
LRRLRKRRMLAPTASSTGLFAGSRMSHLQIKKPEYYAMARRIAANIARLPELLRRPQE